MAGANQKPSHSEAKPLWSEGHKRAILSSITHLNKRMEELEAALGRHNADGVFAKYDNDLTLAEMQAIRASFARLRQAMAAGLADAGIAQDTRRASLRWAVRVNLTYMSVALAELTPKNLRAYGPIDDAAAAAVERLQEGLSALLRQLESGIAPPAPDRGESH